MGFLRALIVSRDSGGYVTGEIPWGSVEQSYKIKLGIGVEETLAVPTWAFRFKFTITAGTVWCGHGVTPLVAATNAWATETSEPNPQILSQVGHWPSHRRPHRVGYGKLWPCAVWSWL